MNYDWHRSTLANYCFYSVGYGSWKAKTSIRSQQEECAVSYGDVTVICSFIKKRVLLSMILNQFNFKDMIVLIVDISSIYQPGNSNWFMQWSITLKSILI